MARNKYPEHTVEQILTISAKLFIERGYEKTTIQDILDELKMSKGAIYHHFKSKEEIFEAICRKSALEAKAFLNGLIQNTKGVNAKERLQKIIGALIADIADSELDTALFSQTANPHFTLASIQSSVADAGLISELFAAGVKDGSIQTDYPLECAEIFLMLFNIWLNPILFGRNFEQTKRRLSFLQLSMRQIGADIITDGLIKQILDGYKNRKVF